MLFILFLSLISASLTIFINYCIGKPSGEFSPYEIFSGYTVWLSIWRLKRVGLYDGYIKQYNENANRQTKHHEIIQLNRDFEKILYNAAEPFFTWERAVGICPVCTGFWVSLGIGIGFYENLLYLVSVIVISHIFIRIINKVI